MIGHIAAGIAAVRPLRRSSTNEASADAYARGVWSCLVEPGDGVAGALVAARGATVALHDATRGGAIAAAAAAGITPGDMRDALARWLPRLRQDAVAMVFEVAAHFGVSLVTPGDDEWPAALDDLGPHAPLCLWVRGDTRALTGVGPAIALVGARAASGYGEHVAAELASDLAGRGVTVVSGAAYGIDGVAHRATLAEGGNTVALLAGGVDRPYPAGHTRLLDDIAARGAVVSEVPCGSAPTKWRFLQRNRNIAALAGATVVVEAGWRSGSLNTAGHASQLGRALGAVPGPVTSATSAGCHRLLREYGAQCVTCADDVLELLGVTTDAHAPSDVRAPAEHTRVTDALNTRVGRPVADIARRAGLSTTDVTAALGAMLLEGTVHTDGIGWRRMRPTSSR